MRTVELMSPDMPSWANSINGKKIIVLISPTEDLDNISGFAVLRVIHHDNDLVVARNSDGEVELSMSNVHRVLLDDEAIPDTLPELGLSRLK